MHIHIHIHIYLSVCLHLRMTRVHFQTPAASAGQETCDPVTCFMANSKFSFTLTFFVLSGILSFIAPPQGIV